jgi:hypothetical protein
VRKVAITRVAVVVALLSLAADNPFAAQRGRAKKGAARRARPPKRQASAG